MNLLTMLLGSFASDASVNSLSHKTGVSSSMLTKLDVVFDVAFEREKSVYLRDDT